MQPWKVLYLGDTRHDELREAFAWLRQNAQCRAADSIEQALTMLAGDWSPNLIVLAEPRRGCFAASAIERLRRAQPLTPLVSLLGSWCEGETRSGSPLPGVERIAWHQWPQRLSGLLSNAPGAPRLVLPRTATMAEVTLSDADQAAPAATGMLLIHARSADAFDALADACQLAGYSALWKPAADPAFARGAVAGLWDGDGCGADEAERLRQWAESLRGLPVIALFNFPRRDDIERAVAAGAAAVLGKPLVIQDLWSELDRHIELRHGIGKRYAG